MTFDQFFHVLVQVAFTVIGTLLLIIFRQVYECLRRLEESVASLNIKMAMYIQKTDDHGERIGRIENKLDQ